jgi:proteasome lid subunit RPN8/RPN11
MAATAMPVLGQEMRVHIAADCRARFPNQACGLILFDAAGNARSVEPIDNHGAWPYGFAIAPEGQFEAFRKARANGWKIGGVYHCHLVSEAVPTGRDLRRPIPDGFLYVIASMLDPDQPTVRAYLLNDGKPVEVTQPQEEACT